MVSYVGVVTGVTSAITGAIVSVVVVVSLSGLVEESSSLLLLQEMIVRLKRILKLCIKLYSSFSFTSNERK